MQKPVGSQAPASEHWMSRGVWRSKWHNVHLETVFCAGWRAPGVTRCRLHCSLQEGSLSWAQYHFTQTPHYSMLTTDGETSDHCLEVADSSVLANPAQLSRSIDEMKCGVAACCGIQGLLTALFLPIPARLCSWRKGWKPDWMGNALMKPKGPRVM